MKVVRIIGAFAAMVFQGIIYFLFCRLLLTIQIWKGIPSFENWCKYPELIKQTYKDAFIVSGTTITHISLTQFMPFYISWLTIVLFVIIVYVINIIVARHKIKNLSDEEREILGLLKKRKS